jgi:Protein of unknown function (DUF1501)
MDEEELLWTKARSMTRRTFMGAGLGLGAIAATQLAAGATPENKEGKKKRVKSVIYLHMSGAPPTLDLFDYKPKLTELNLQDCPESLIKGERFAFIKGRPKMLGTPHPFTQNGKSGMWMSSLLPHTAKIVDDLCMIHSMSTDQFNHAPAEMFLYTGSAFAGNPAMGSWITYGLGTQNKDLPGFVVLLSGGTDPTGGKSIWSSGFLPSIYQGVQCRSAGDPILYLQDPNGMSRETRRRTLDALATLNQEESKRFNDPETATRIAQYELAYRMQISVPDAMDIKKETEATRERYGAKPGEASFANNCLLARRLVEKGVRYVQLYDWGWDIHGTNPGDDLMTALPKKCQEVDKASAALVMDLKERGLLEDTLIIWGGEFGRTPMNEARGGSKYLGRDHHPHCFSMWMAGGGVKPGHVHGATDELGWRISEGKMTVRDLQATVLWAMGLDPYTHHFAYQGLDQRLIGPTNEAIIRKELFG